MISENIYARLQLHYAYIMRFILSQNLKNLARSVTEFNSSVCLKALSLALSLCKAC